MATAEQRLQAQHPQCLFAACSASEIIPVVLNRAHGWSSHPLSLTQSSPRWLFRRFRLCMAVFSLKQSHSFTEKHKLAEITK